MRVAMLPTVQAHRDLYAVPLGPARFDAYLRMLTAGTKEPVLPVGLSNPMAKPHALAYCDALLALDAEAVAREAAAEASRRLAHVEGELRVGLALGDDVAGGWTDRGLTEAKHRFDQTLAKKGLAAALIWLGEPPTRAGVRAAVLAACYRHAHAATHGRPRTLGEMMAQEGRAARFAEAQEPALAPEELRRVRDVLAPLRASTSFPPQFAALYGDAHAARAGHAPLGLPHRAGYALALAEAREGPPPETLVGAWNVAGKTPRRERA